MVFIKCGEKIRSFLNRATLFHVIIIGCLFSTISIYFHHGGFLHPEMELRLPYILSDRPLINKLFDSRVLDQDFYRARELSYLVDFLDSKFMEFCVRIGIPHFLSITHYLFAILICCILYQFCKKELKIELWTILGLLVLFWTSPSIFLGGNLFRSGKMAVALTFSCLFVSVYEIASVSWQNKNYQFPFKFWLTCFGIGLCSTFLDEQGVYLIGTIIAFFLLWLFGFKNKNIYYMLLTCVAILFFHLIFRFLIAPYSTFVLNGYWPNFSYQWLALSNFLTDFFPYLDDGFGLWLDTLYNLFGNATAPLFLLLLFPFIYFRILFDNNKIVKLVCGELLLTNFFLVILMNVYMVMQHPPLVWSDVRLIYYWLPTIVLLLMTSSFLVSVIFHDPQVPKWILLLAMGIAIIGNVSALPKSHNIIKNGHVKEYFPANALLLRALNNMGNSNYIIPELIQQNPIYIMFADKIEMNK